MERGVLVRALYTNKPEAKNELFFRKGDILTVIEVNHENQEGWWLCSLRGQRGIVPFNYFEIIEDKYSNPTTAADPSVATATSHANANPTNIPGGEFIRRAGEMEMAESDSMPDSSSFCPPVLDPLETYDVPKSYRERILPSASAATQNSPSHSLTSLTEAEVNPLELYDVPRSQRTVFASNSDGLASLHHGSSSDFVSSQSQLQLQSQSQSKSRVRVNIRQSELSLSSTGSSPHLFSSSSSSSSSTRSSANCEVVNVNDNGKTGENSMGSCDDSFFQNGKKSSRSSMQSDSGSENNPSSSTTIPEPFQELYDVPRSAPTSRAHSAMSALSTSSGLGLSIANSDSKDSLDFYDVPRSSLATALDGGGGSVHAYVNHLETKYDRVHSNHNGDLSHCRNRDQTPPTPPPHSRNSCSSINSLNVNSSSSGALSSSSSQVQNQPQVQVQSQDSIQNQNQNQAPDELYDVPRSSCPAVPAKHGNPHPLSTSLASMSLSKESLRSNNGHGRFLPHKFGSSVDMRRRGFIQVNNGLHTAHSVDTVSSLSFPHNLSQSQSQNQNQSQNQSRSQSQHSSYDMLAQNPIGASNSSINSNSHSGHSHSTITSNHRINRGSVSGGSISCLQSRGSFSSCCSRNSDGRSYMDNNNDGHNQRRDSQCLSGYPNGEDVKILPLNPRAAVTVSEKLRHEVVTSINSILDFVRPKWRSKSNLTEIMPDLRFSCTRLNLAIKDMVDFCSRCLSNAKKFSGEALVPKLQRLLQPLTNGSQIIQRDVDELDAYFWSVERLSVASDNGKITSSDALDQLVLCARSLIHDVTEVANFLAYNSSALFREAERLNPPVSTNVETAQVMPNPNTVQGGETGQPDESGPVEDYDYVSLMPMENGACALDNNIKTTGTTGDSCDSIETLTNATATQQLLPSDEQLLEFYAAQIAITAPLLSQSISTFISSIQSNDPPKTFNGHLKYVILLAYKMLFAGDTVHRNIINCDIKKEVEDVANQLHSCVIELHQASRDAAKNFPKIPPMQKIVERVWETTRAATSLKAVIFNAACF